MISWLLIEVCSWLVSNQGFTEVLEEWMRSVSTRYNDVYFVTELQVRAGEVSDALVGDPVDTREEHRLSVE